MPRIIPAAVFAGVSYVVYQIQYSKETRRYEEEELKRKADLALLQLKQTKLTARLEESAKQVEGYTKAESVGGAVEKEEKRQRAESERVVNELERVSRELERQSAAAAMSRAGQ